MRHVFVTMGTALSIDLPGVDAAAHAVAQVEQIFQEADDRFSLYRPNSELSQIAAGTTSLMTSSAELRRTYAEALFWRDKTNGAFTPHRPDGVVDLNGIVKSMALERAGTALDDAGLVNWSLNAGGDVFCHGEQEHQRPWTVGIVDPEDRGALLCSLALHGSRRAVATSGSAERGDHIWRDGSHDAVDFRQVTVVADDIVTADVLATAIVSGGETSLEEISARWPIDVLTVDRERNLRATPGLRAALLA